VNTFGNSKQPLCTVSCTSTNWKTQMVKVLKGGNNQQKIVNTLMQLMQSEEEAMINRHFRNTKQQSQKAALF
jgi:phage-related protein